MAWIESHQRLKSDPKLKRFCRALRVSRPTGIGMLHELWWWALDHAESGDLSKLDHRDLAQEMDWPEKRAEQLWQALTEIGPDGEPGFVDATGQIHSWNRYAGRLMGERIRKRRQREKARDSHGTDAGQSALDHTQPNQDQDRTKDEVRADDGFDRFWTAYPRKQAKAEASKAWSKLRLDSTLLTRILEAVEAHKGSQGWQQDGGKFIPLPASWIRGRRWEDEVKSPATVGGHGGSKYGSLVEH